MNVSISCRTRSGKAGSDGAPGEAAALVLVLVMGLVALSGCAKPLFQDNGDRSQYDRYDRVRSIYADPYVFDAFGQRRPNLRARLLPKN